MPTVVAKRKRTRRGSDFHMGLAQRFNVVAGDLSFREVGTMTGTNPETARRYMLTGRVPSRFLAEFCTAFDIDPRWLLYGTGRMRVG